MQNKSDIFFYVLMGLMTFTLLTWFMSFSSYKNEQINSLQNQINSLITFTNKAHPDIDTLNIQQHIKAETMHSQNRIKHIVIVHSSVFILLLFLAFLYIRCIRNEKKSCLPIKHRKKIK